MKTFKYIVYTLAAVIAFASCAKEQENEYKATPAPTGDEVQFAQISENAAFDKVTKVISLTGNTDKYFDIYITREKADKMALVGVESVADPEVFSVATSAVFEKGEKTAAIRIDFNPDELVSQKSYDITLTLSGEPVSKYAVSTITFQAGDVLPLEWHTWLKGTFYPVFFDMPEESDLVMSYAVLDGDATSKALFKTFVDNKDIKDPITAFQKEWKPKDGEFLDLYCKIENCYISLKDEDFIPLDYYFTWHLKDNYLIVSPQYLYSHSTYGPVYFADIVGYYISKGATEAQAIAVAEQNGYSSERAYYDGNGGFYLSIEFFVSAGFFGVSKPDSFIANGFVRTVNYNPSGEVYSYKDFMSGSIESIGLNDAWDDQPLQINEYKAASADKALYYLPDYFGPELGLAFTGPLQGNLKDGLPIQGVANEQPTGMEYGGKPLFAVVTGGKITKDDAGNYVFTIKVQYETMTPSEEDPDKLVVYGTLPEVDEIFTSSYVAEYYSDYQIEPVKNKRDFYGVYRATAKSDKLGGPFEFEMTISEAGWSGDRTKQYVAITGIGNTSVPFPDVIYALYKDGYIVVEPQTTAGVGIYSGDYSLVDPLASADFSTQTNILGGIYTNPDTKEQKLVFVGDGSLTDGFDFYLYNSGKEFDFVWDVFADYTGHEVIEEEVEDTTPAPAVRSLSKKVNHVRFNGHHLRSVGKEKKAVSRSFALSIPEARSMEIQSGKLL